MNYNNIYTQIINKALSLNRNKKLNYFEKHHIIPKCLGGTNDKNNLVLLTAKEHFICHKLLIKIYPNESKLKYALWAMCNQITKNRNYKISAQSYQTIREIYSKLNSIRHLGKTGPMKGLKRNPNIGLKISKTKQQNPIKRKHSIESKLKISISKLNNPTKNSKFKGYYITPLGKFHSASQASKIHNLDVTVIIKRCVSKNNSIISNKSLRKSKDLNKYHINKTFKELGWGFEPQFQK